MSPFLHPFPPSIETDPLATFTLQVFKNLLASSCSRTKDKAPGYDQVKKSYLVHSPEPLIHVIFLYILDILRGLPVPPQHKHSLIKLIYKQNPQASPSPSLPSSFRPIALLPLIFKLVSKSVDHLMRQHIADNTHILPPSQAGFRRLHACQDKITELAILQHTHPTAHTLFLDFCKAFDSVDLDILTRLLYYFRFPTYLIQAITSLYQDCTFQVLTPTGLTPSHPKGPKGVHQGCPLSPLLFAIYITPLLQALTPLTHSALAYADDVAIVFNPHRWVPLEQCLMQFQHAFGIEIHPAKSKAQLHQPGPTPQPLPLGSGHITYLPSAAHYRYLGNFMGCSTAEAIALTQADVTQSLTTFHLFNLSFKQRIDIINFCIFPKIAYRLSGRPLQPPDITPLYRNCLSFIKRAIDTPPYLPNFWLLASPKHGGYGLHDLYTSIASNALHQAQSLLYGTCNPVASTLFINHLADSDPAPPVQAFHEYCHHFRLSTLSQPTHPPQTAHTTSSQAASTFPSLMVSSASPVSPLPVSSCYGPYVLPLSEAIQYYFHSAPLSFDHPTPPKFEQQRQAGSSICYDRHFIPSTLRLYTDGSQRNHRGGASVFCPQLGISLYATYLGPQTAGRGELVAVLLALYFWSLLDPNVQFSSCVVFTDYKWAATSLPALLRRHSVQTAKLLRYRHADLLSLMGQYYLPAPSTSSTIHHLNRVLPHSNNVSFVWVKAHLGLPGNERADALAKVSTTLPPPPAGHPTTHTDLYYCGTPVCGHIIYTLLMTQPSPAHLQDIVPALSFPLPISPSLSLNKWQQGLMFWAGFWPPSDAKKDPSTCRACLQPHRGTVYDAIITCPALLKPLLTPALKLIPAHLDGWWNTCSNADKRLLIRGLMPSSLYTWLISSHQLSLLKRTWREAQVALIKHLMLFRSSLTPELTFLGTMTVGHMLFH
jgi:ribonuclease HI